MLTDENKQKYLMEKEKKERVKKRNANTGDKDDVKAEKPKGKFGRKGKEVVEEPVKKKKVVKKIVKKREENLFNENEIDTNKDIVEDITSVKQQLDNNETLLNKPEDDDIFKGVNNDVSLEYKSNKIKDETKSENDGESLDKLDDSDIDKKEDEHVEYSKDDLTSEVSEDEDDDINVESTIPEVKTDDETEILTSEEIIPEVEEDEEEDAYMKQLRLEEEELRKKEMVQKKLDEEEHYFELMLTLPPSSDTDFIITRALDAGVPEWYLREIGVIVDDSDREEVVSTLVVGLDEIRKQGEEESQRIKLEIAHQEAEIELKLKEGLQHRKNIKKVDTEEVQKEVFVEDTSDVETDTESIEDEVLLDSEEISNSTDEVVNVEDKVLLEESTLDDKDNENNIEVSDEVTFIKEEISDSNEDVILTDEVSVENTEEEVDKSLEEEDAEIPTVEVTIEPEDNEDTSNVSDESDEPDESDDDYELSEEISEEVSKLVINRDLLKDRLKSIADNRVKSVVLNVTGDQIFVKEEKQDEFGNKKTNYKNYKVDEDDVKNVEVGKEISEEIKLEHLDKKLLIGGVEYDVTKSEEDRLAKELARREIWIVTTDTPLVNNIKSNLEGTRYKVLQVTNERDFVMATRSTYNVLVITQKIPSTVKNSIISYLKYLGEEEKRARIVSLEDSLVKANVIEYQFKEIVFDELEYYYNSFDASLYSDSKKSTRDILKVISFDLTEGIIEQVDITEEENEEDTRFLDLELDLSTVDLSLEENDSGDMVLDISDFGTIILDDRKELSLGEELEIDEIKGENK